MFPQSDTPEMVTVVHHPAFRKLYEEELAQEGLDIAVLSIREAFKQTVTVFVDHERKPVEELEIELPLISDAVETTAELPGLTLDEVKQRFQQHFRPLPIGKKKEGLVEYKERHLFTDEIVARMQLDVGLLTNAWSAAGYFAQMLGRACRLTNPHQVLAPLVEEFLAKVLFEREVDLYSGEVDHRMRDADVVEHVRATFTPLILAKMVHRKQRHHISRGVRLSTWKPYQATSTADRPAVTAQRTMFNLVPCGNDFERGFADFCDFAGDVAAFAKNAGPQKLMVDYLRPDGHRALYVPDFLVRLRDDGYLLCELKGKTDDLVPVKARTAMEWCKAASKGQVKWRYLYVPYHLFQQSAPGAMEELARACEPSLRALIEEAETGQQELPLREAAAQKEAEDLFARVLQQAGITQPPSPLADAMRQAVTLLDHAVRSGMPDYAHAFQPLLHPLDEYALRILDRRLSPRIPADPQKRDDYFRPYLESLSPRDRNLLSKNGRYLQDNLLFGRSVMKLGTLLFCLDYARQGGRGAPGVWQDVAPVFASPEVAVLHPDLEQVNSFRNTRVAHVETKLNNPDEAWGAMRIWLRCLANMHSLAG